MSSLRRLAAVLLLLVLAGCGFRPLYGEQSFGSVVPDLQEIKVLPIRDRVGQKMYNMLLDRLNPHGVPDRPLYTLAIENAASREELGLEITEVATRAKLTLVSRYVLRRVDNQELLFSGSARSINSFNLIDSDYANLVAEEDATERALRENSEAIRARLGIFFDRARNQSPNLSP